MPPSFLSLISYFGHETLSCAGDHVFGGFRSLKSFSEPRFNFKALGRSGYHFRLVFELRTVFQPPWHDAEQDDGKLSEHETDENPSGKNHAGTFWRLFPSWLRPRDRGSGSSDAAIEMTEQTSDHPVLWPLDRCAIYHHFDVENGKSLWIMTAAEGEGNKYRFGPEAHDIRPFWDVRDARFSTNVLSTSSMDERFNASLAVLIWLANWSLSEYGKYISMLDDDLLTFVCYYSPKPLNAEGKPGTLTTAR